MNIGNIPAKIARLDPSREAIIDVHSEQRINYGELDARVRRLANAFSEKLKLAKGDRVAILSKNSIEYMEIYYACARAGYIAQPLNWRLGIAELSRIVADGEPSVLIAHTEYAAQCEQLKSSVGVVHWLSFGPESDGSYTALIEGSHEQEPTQSLTVGDDDPVLILYTGGTTGESKGALHTHKSLYMGMLNQTVAERIVPGDVYMLTGQMFHIPVALAMNYMAHGCPVVLINFDAQLALEVIQRERVSAFLGITTMLNWMMAVENFDQYDLSSLRNIQYGGGPMPQSVVQAALDAFPCTIIQGYGQTEGMTMSFLSQEDHSDALQGRHPERLASCGREGHVTSIKLVDHDGNEVPKDGQTAGEIIVRSDANMIGYWRRPDLTAATLRDGWMWTGDIAYWDADGYLFIVDRAKDMIISGGENIYSTQVEAAIHQHPAVLESAVFGVPDEQWGEAVKAVVVLKPGQQATAEEIIVAASEHLASYQKPRSVDFVDSLPKAPDWQDSEKAITRSLLAATRKTALTAELSAEVLSAIGRQGQPQTEVVTRRDIRKYAIATNQSERKYLDGNVAPPMFHLALFWPVVELDELMPDGVSVDSLLPKFPLEKAMAGGLELKYLRPIYPGDVLTAQRTLTDIYLKQGSQGPIIFYEVVMEVTDNDGNDVVWEKTTRLLR